MAELGQLVTNSIGAVAALGILVWYMTKRDKIIQDSMDKFTDKLDKLANAVIQMAGEIAHVRHKSLDDANK